MSEQRLRDNLSKKRGGGRQGGAHQGEDSPTGQPGEAAETAELPDNLTQRKSANDTQGDGGN
jgi:hypothetical protein